MKRTLLALPVVALMASTAMAQTVEVPPYHPDPGPYPGWWELTLAGSGTSTNSFDNNSFGAAVGIGYYLTKNVIVGFRQFVGFQLVDSTEFPGQNDTWTGTSVVSADYQFDLGRWQPFIGVGVGATYGGRDVESDGIWGPQAGLKYYVNESTFVIGQAVYGLTFDECCDDGTFNYTLGLGVNF
jgi:hypothetical protein